jgi:hypothetical protein
MKDKYGNRISVGTTLEAMVCNGPPPPHIVCISIHNNICAFESINDTIAAKKFKLTQSDLDYSNWKVWKEK